MSGIRAIGWAHYCMGMLLNVLEEMVMKCEGNGRVKDLLGWRVGLIIGVGCYRIGWVRWGLMRRHSH